jgi:hypothetical protein
MPGDVGTVLRITSSSFGGGKTSDAISHLIIHHSINCPRTLLKRRYQSVSEAEDQEEGAQEESSQSVKKPRVHQLTQTVDITLWRKG